MKKDERVLLNFIDFLVDKCLKVTKKIGKIANNKNSEDIIKIMFRLIIVILLIILLDIPFGFIKILGIYILYAVGTMFREFLSIIWTVVVYFTYAISSLLLLFKTFEGILKDKELNIVEKDRKTDKKVKNSIFVPLMNITKILLIISCIPIVIFILFLIICLGGYVAILVKGYGLIGISFILIGFIVIFITLLKVIAEFVKGGKNNEKIH